MQLLSGRRWRWLPFVVEYFFLFSYSPQANAKAVESPVFNFITTASTTASLGPSSSQPAVFTDVTSTFSNLLPTSTTLVHGSTTATTSVPVPAQQSIPPKAVFAIAILSPLALLLLLGFLLFLCKSRRRQEQSRTKDFQFSDSSAPVRVERTPEIHNRQSTRDTQSCFSDTCADHHTPQPYHSTLRDKTLPVPPAQVFIPSNYRSHGINFIAPTLRPAVLSAVTEVSETEMDIIPAPAKKAVLVDSGDRCRSCVVGSPDIGICSWYVRSSDESSSMCSFESTRRSADWSTLRSSSLDRSCSQKSADSG
jgi:hypothetical protein